MCRTGVNRIIDILLVEDNPGDRELTKMALQGAGVSCNIREAPDGEQALIMLFGDDPDDGEPTRTPDFIFLDLNLPKVNGLEVLTQIRRHPRTKHVPVLVLSTSKADQDVTLSYRLHANGYVVKPDDFEELRKIVEVIDAFWFGVAQLPTAWDGDLTEWDKKAIRPDCS